MPLSLFRRRRHREPAHALYLALVAQARKPAFYEGFGVPDTVDGRFDMIALHAFLLLHRLKGARQEAAREAAAELGQEIFDLMFADMDRNLREMGAGDLGIAPRVKKMIGAFYGRIAAYEAGLAAPKSSVLPDAIRRNLFRGVEPTDREVEAMADYVRHQAAFLADQPADQLLAGIVRFAAP